jgi:hypothetical protein
MFGIGARFMIGNHAAPRKRRTRKSRFSKRLADGAEEALAYLHATFRTSQISQFENTTPRGGCGSGYPSYVIRRSVQRTRYPRATR